MNNPNRLIKGAAALAWLCASTLSCGGAQQPDPEPAGGEAPPALEPPAVEELTGAVTMEQLQGVLGRSVGEFLGLVELEAEVEGGAFQGWRLQRLPESQPSWLDLQRGDVVTAVNGMPVERPDDAQRIWETCRIASEIRIDLVRDGERRSVRIPVMDQPEDGGDAEEGSPAEERRGPEE